MARRNPNTAGPTPPDWVEIAGFKALRDPVRIRLAPLTLLAGANSSGKSSAMQPILLLKQTLEAPYDPGPLLLDGPHVQFTEPDQFLSRGKRKGERARELSVTLGPIPKASYRLVRLRSKKRRSRTARVRTPSPEVRLRVAKNRSASFDLAPPSVDQRQDADWVELTEDMDHERFVTLARVWDPRSAAGVIDAEHVALRKLTARFLVDLEAVDDDDDVLGSIAPLDAHVAWLRSVLHLPGLRGHRDRRYTTARVTEDDGTLQATGPFTPYAASVLVEWVDEDDPRLGDVQRWLRALTLTWKVLARRVSAAEIELKVGRTAEPQQGGAHDLVDIADVGFGVSQVLPVLVALAAATKGQIVYIEQPELHLHPRAQRVMGRILAEAAARGVRVVVETHSRMVLRSIQTAIAAGELAPDDVGLHWFGRDQQTGFTRVENAEVSVTGSFGQWPVDFSEVEAEADDAWLELAVGTDR